MEYSKTNKELLKDIISSLDDIKKGDYIYFSSSQEMKSRISKNTKKHPK